MTETLPPLAVPDRPGALGALRDFVAGKAEFLRYVLIGGGAFLIDIGLFALLHLVAGMHPLLANTISVFTSMVFSFTLNAFANFQVRDRLLPRFLSFLVVCGIGYLISMGVLALLVEVFAVDATIAKLVSLPLVLIVQFLANKHVTFGSALSATPEGNAS